MIWYLFFLTIIILVSVFNGIPFLAGIASNYSKLLEGILFNLMVWFVLLVLIYGALNWQSVAQDITVFSIFLYVSIGAVDGVFVRPSYEIGKMLTR